MTNDLTVDLPSHDINGMLALYDFLEVFSYDKAKYDRKTLIHLKEYGTDHSFSTYIILDYKVHIVGDIDEVFALKHFKTSVYTAKMILLNRGLSFTSHFRILSIVRYNFYKQLNQ